jgi:uncharacterized Rmd1/YagE family protein
MSRRYQSKSYREFVHVKVPVGDDQGDAFFFAYGSMVFWGFNQEMEDQLLIEIREFEKDRYDFIESDEFTYTLGSEPTMIEDEIVLPDLRDLTLIAVSHGLAQSVKLGSFELTAHNTYEKTKYIPEMLAQKGTIPLSRKQIRKQMGSLFLERAWINLHVDALEIPEFFWEHPDIEPIYEMVAHYLEIESRVEVLNQRLTVVHDLFEMLGNELNHQHSSRLEWAIILLILFEVTLFLFHEIFHWV